MRTRNALVAIGLIVVVLGFVPSAEATKMDVLLKLTDDNPQADPGNPWVVYVQHMDSKCAHRDDTKDLDGNPYGDGSYIHFSMVTDGTTGGHDCSCVCDKYFDIKIYTHLPPHQPNPTGARYDVCSFRINGNDKKDCHSGECKNMDAQWSIVKTEDFPGFHCVANEGSGSGGFSISIEGDSSTTP